MDTKISSNNPFGYDRYGFLWEIISQKAKGLHLDYGAYDGRIITQMAETNIIDRGIGVDVNEMVVEKNTQNMPSNVNLVKIEKSTQLPYPDSYFDSLSILDVIEHIQDQKSLLTELNRVLKVGGSLVVTVPKKHVFSWLDMGNFKFIFPKTHRFFYERKYSKDEYYNRYLLCENGLFGDIEKEKMWHQHFSNEEMSELLQECGFQLMNFDGSGLFIRPLLMLQYVSPKPISTWIGSLAIMDARKFAAANLFCVAQKMQVNN
jgi:ubiquinone/menaquinone biosynthesis C-methylase UbiE